MSTGASYGYSQQPSYGMGGMGGYGSMYGSYNPYAQMGGYGSMYGGFSPYGGMGGYGMSLNPYQSPGFGGGYGGMGGYNSYGGYGQVGLGYLPPQQPTINDSVANQFMQQYYGGAFGLGGQPQPRRQRPRNPFRSQPLMQPDVQPAVMPDYRTGPETYQPVAATQDALSEPNYSGIATNPAYMQQAAFAYGNSEEARRNSIQSQLNNAFTASQKAGKSILESAREQDEMSAKLHAQYGLSMRPGQ